MKKMLLSMAAVPFVLGSLSINASADTGISILDDVKFKGEIRPRYESASDKSNTAKAASAMTARTSLGMSASVLGVSGLSTYIEATSVNNFGYTNYNSTNNGNIKYDVIVDPQQARITQAYVDYKAGDTLVRAGRQMVNFDNQRFVGAVGWRQMFQTFDALAVVNSSVKNLTLLGAYVYGINNVKFNAQAADTKSVLLHANYKVMDELSVTAYDYMLGSISNTYGVALTGNIDAGAKLNYRLEYAKQSDPSLEYQTKNIKADANYYNLDIGTNISGILAGVNYEVLSGSTGSDGKTAFATPLATGHKFNGWADKFLTTPTGGLKDMNIRLGYTKKGLGKLLAVYHNFSTDKAMGSKEDLGSEIDALYANAIPGLKGLSGLAKLALYKGGDVAGFNQDKSVAWLMLDYKFATK